MAVTPHRWNPARISPSATDVGDAHGRSSAESSVHICEVTRPSGDSDHRRRLRQQPLSSRSPHPRRTPQSNADRACTAQPVPAAIRWRNSRRPRANCLRFLYDPTQGEFRHAGQTTFWRHWHTNGQGQARKVEWIRRWWRQPDHYQWLSAYLAVRNLQRFTRYMMAAIVAALGLVPVLMLFTPAGPQRTGGTRVVSRSSPGSARSWRCCGSSGGRRAISRRPSSSSPTSAIATSCLVDASPGTGIQGCTAFAALAGYVAFFHTSRLLGIHPGDCHGHGARLCHGDLPPVTSRWP